MPVIEINKQIDQLLGESPDMHSADVAEERNPPIPEYPFVERARIADVFFGPDAESTDGGKTLTRRIQVVSDLAALCKMRQQCRYGKPFNWNKVDETAHDIITHQDNEDTKTIEPSPLRHPRHHGPLRTSTHSVSLRMAFLRQTACDGMRESIRLGAMCSESI
jgi:hypothetical protein